MNCWAFGRKTLDVQRQRFQIHYTPTYASWLNQVERWFALLSSREIRRGSFASAKDLVARITAFVAAYKRPLAALRLAPHRRRDPR
jgi:transposase